MDQLKKMISLEMFYNFLTVNIFHFIISCSLNIKINVESNTAVTAFININHGSAESICKLTCMYL